jgi:aspartate-semialdehyde dehydrogenase
MSVLAVLHPTTLLGKELCESLGRNDLTGPPWREVRLLSTLEPEVGTLTEVAGAAAIVQRYEPGSLEGVSIAFFCGPAALNRPLLAALPPEVTAVVLSPDATPADGRPVVAGINHRGSDRHTAAGAPEILLSPHPAVVLLAHLLHPLAALCEPRAVTATAIQPASMHDNAGIEELFEQTRQIVAMTPRRRWPVFGAQLAFNLLPAADAEPTAAAIDAALGSVLAAPVPVSAQLLQGAVFHGLALSCHVRCAAAPPSVAALRKALAASPYVELARDPRHLGPVEAAASDKVLVGALRRDERGVSLWAVIDNLTRGGARNALEIAAAVH